MKKPKITVVGAGNVGATAAHRIALLDLADVALIDIVEGLPQGKALDMMQAAPVEGWSVKVEGSNDHAAGAGSDVVIITSGIPRKPGMSRDDLLRTNAGIVADVAGKVAAVSPDAVLIIVSNPLDAMTYVAHRASKFPQQRVVGMAGALDAARFRAFLAMELGVDPAFIHALVLGGHGDTMVPLTRYTTVAGVPVEQRIKKKRLDEIVNRTRNGGAEIVGLLKTGSAFYAPAAAAVEMARAILLDTGAVVPCAAFCKGQYGVRGLFVGVPAKLGKRGVEQVIEFELSAADRKALDNSSAAVKTLCAEVDKLMGWKRKG